MGRYTIVGYCNPVEGQDQVFNDWYWTEHMKDILALPGVISGKRFVPAAGQLPGVELPFQYMGLFEVETDDPEALVQEMLKRSAAGLMSRSDSVAPGSSLVLWQVMEPSTDA